uniref:Hyaluronan/mRNA-binding protein domain-containing protein n=1 Tax=Picea sitchensis TaxID=3332 RepID=A9NJX1_PICSI|nr:unknown [Picea sitchensis]
MATVKAKLQKREEDHFRARDVKKGIERLDRRSASGINGSPKKGGHGGKFTWGGFRSSDPPYSQPALDEKDPNYMDRDDEEEEAQ